jgi:hypothetical protein
MKIYFEVEVQDQQQLELIKSALRNVPDIPFEVLPYLFLPESVAAVNR